MVEQTYSLLLPVNTVTHVCPAVELAKLPQTVQSPRTGMSRMLNERMAPIIKETFPAGGKDSFDTSPECSDEDHENSKAGVVVELTLVIPQGPRSSIGLRLCSSEIAGVAHASAAERSGLRVGDQILSVQGELATLAPPLVGRTAPHIPSIPSAYPQRIYPRLPPPLTRCLPLAPGVKTSEGASAAYLIAQRTSDRQLLKILRPPSRKRTSECEVVSSRSEEQFVPGAAVLIKHNRTAEDTMKAAIDACKPKVLHVGSRVRIEGLMRRCDLNGALGTVHHFVPGQRGAADKWAVHCDGELGCVLFDVQVHNLLLVASEAPAEQAEQFPWEKMPGSPRGGHAVPWENDLKRKHDAQYSAPWVNDFKRKTDQIAPLWQPEYH